MQPTQIAQYIPILFLLAAAVGFAAGTLAVSVLLGKAGKRTKAKDTAYECGKEPIGEAWVAADECKVANGPFAGQSLGALCKQFGTLLILDEIQTGFGRTGGIYWFRFRTLGLQPDLLCLAKALGGGISAIGVTMATDEVWHAAFGKKEDSALHTSTFGGGSISCIVGLAAIMALKEGN